MKYIIYLVFLSFFYSCASLQVSSVNSLARLGDFHSVNDLSYSNSTKNTLDVYIPQGASLQNPAPVIVFFYGGCWGECVSYYKQDYIFVADALTSKGYLVVIADYRMSPEVMFNELIKDAQTIVNWTHKEIETYHGDKENIFIMGHSSGAHIAVMLSLNEKYLNTDTRACIRGGVGISGPYDFLPYTESYLPRVFGEQKNAAYSQAINYVHKDEVPLLLMYGKKDRVIKERNIINLTKKIHEAKASVTSITYEDFDHQGIITTFTRPLRDDIFLSDINTFIQNNLKKK